MQKQGNEVKRQRREKEFLHGYCFGKVFAANWVLDDIKEEKVQKVIKVLIKRRRMMIK